MVQMPVRGWLLIIEIDRIGLTKVFDYCFIWFGLLKSFSSSFHNVHYQELSKGGAAWIASNGGLQNEILHHSK